jgi:hypothetical protein
MTPDDSEPLFQIIDLVAEVYERGVSAEHKALFFRVLKRFEFTQVAAAFERYLATPDYGKYGFPKPASIVEIIEGSESDREAEAFLSLTRAIEHVGVFKSVIVEDPVLADAITLTYGGWIQACEMKAALGETGWNIQRKEFIAAYRKSRRVVRERFEPRLLYGYCQTQNEEHGAAFELESSPRLLFGAIRVDGTVENKYIQVAPATGLPYAALGDLLALPPVAHSGLLPERTGDEPPTDETIDPPDVVRIRLREIFDQHFGHMDMNRVIERARPKRMRPMTDAEFEARKEELRRQAREYGATSDPDQSTTTLRTEEGPDGGASEERHSDRDPVHGSGLAVADAGVPIREEHRPEMGDRLRMAGVSDRVRDRGRRIRTVDHGTGGVRKPKGQTRAHSTRDKVPRRRQA